MEKNENQRLKIEQLEYRISFWRIMLSEKLKSKEI